MNTDENNKSNITKWKWQRRNTKYDINLFNYVIFGIDVNKNEDEITICCYDDDYKKVYNWEPWKVYIKDYKENLCRFYKIELNDKDCLNLFKENIKKFKFVSTCHLIMHINNENKELEIYDYYFKWSKLLFKYDKIISLEYNRKKVKNALYTHLWEMNM